MDRVEECVYLPGQLARCPARVPVHALTPDQLDLLLEEGDQRVGNTLFRTECPMCSACEPVRVSIPDFAPNRSQRRIFARGEEQLDLEVGRPELSRRKVNLWKRHRRARGLLTAHSRLDVTGYEEWLVQSCAQTLEFRYFHEAKLVGVSLLDLGRVSANSAYHYFDPRFSHLSLGVYSVIKEIQWCSELGMQWYYLGLWVEECRALRYKTGFVPHERLRGGAWWPGAELDSVG